MNNYNHLKAYFLSKPESTLDFPFGDDVSVFKVKNKMFGLIGFGENEMSMNLKCDPDEANALRDIYSSITPGYHMNKKHWITITFTETHEDDNKNVNYQCNVPSGEIFRLIDASFMLVVNKMPKKDQTSILTHM
ncbi:MmcQ/YjbR family DNA-binding protein [Flocculibacter collagenilyticus]|uniref:MmcQ/YjbR family DNA-binding protein n=1 Tax=Flocculibacter collagenilyticus TaxID=2744479 RepID=UPI0018F55298|nr:MmcQ/YjbR family DNA-binding protein [Flocculibacter collagenilyticus]